MTNSNEPKTLKDVALAALDRHGVSGGRELDRIAKAAGLTISYTTVDKIVAGTYTSRPTRTTLDALATLSGIDRRRVYRVAKVPFPMKPLAELLPEGSDTLTASQRRVVVEVVRQFAESNRALRDATIAREDGEGRDVRTPSSTRARGSLAPIPLHPLSVVDETLPPSEDAAAALEDPTIGDELEAQHEEP